MAERFGMQYFETSAKTGLEVNEAFVSILSAELEKHVGNMSMSQSTSDSFRLTDETTGNQAWCSGYSCYNSWIGKWNILEIQRGKNRPNFIFI